MKTFLRKYWHWLTVSVLFVVLVCFFSDLPLVEYLNTKHNVRHLVAEKDAYVEQIERDSIFIEQLKYDEFLEKYARETFYMHSEGEEVYIFED